MLLGNIDIYVIMQAYTHTHAYTQTNEHTHNT